MTVLSPTQLTNLRDRVSGSKFYLSVLHPQVLLSAQVNNAAIARGGRTIAYDAGSGAGYTTTGAGQTLQVTTATGTVKARIKSVSGSQSSGTIVIGENGIPFADNQVLQVLHNYEIFTIPPTIRGGVAYKDYDVPYNGAGSKPTPVAIIGGHRAKRIRDLTLSVQISTGPDDGIINSLSQYSNSGTSLASGSTSGITFNNWLRFQNVTIPKDAPIISATLTVVASNSDTGTTNLKIAGEAADNPTAPTGYANYNTRVLTTAQVDWDITDNWTAGDIINSVDISTIIQELVNRAGWSSGNALNIFVRNDSSSNYRRIVAYNGTPAQAAILKVTYTEYPAFALNASQSYAVAQGASIAATSWSCVHNGGGTGGITIADSTDPTTTMTITQADEYWLSCTVTDSNGKGQTTRRVIIVADDNNPPYTDFDITNFSGSWGSGGWRLTIDAFGDVTLADFPDGSIAILWYENYFDPATDNEEGYVNLWGIEDNVLFAGYIRRDTSNEQPGQGTGKITFELTTPESLLDNITDFGTISLNATTNPARWWQYASWLTVGRAIHSYLKWQTTLLDVCDVLGLTDNTIPKKVVNFTEPSTRRRVDSLAYERGHFAKLVSSRLGRLHLATDSQMLNTSERAALDTVFTLGLQDIADAVAIPREPEERVAVVFAGGFTWNGTTQAAVLSIAGGYRESSISYGLPGFRGTEVRQIKEQVTTGQTDMNEKSGRVLAAFNIQIKEFRVTFAGNYLSAFDLIPANGFYEWGIANDALLRELALNGTLLICRDIQPKIDVPNGVISVEVYFEPEALGPDGIIGNYPTAYPVPQSPPRPPWNPAYEMVFVGSTDSGVFLKNWGQSPTVKNTGLSGTELNIRCLQMNPITKDVWICHQAGLAYSSDDGNTWTDVTAADLGDPVNTAGDSPAPVTADLDNIWLSFDESGTAYLLRTWDSPQRAWLYTADSTLAWSNTQVTN